MAKQYDVRLRGHGGIKAERIVKYVNGLSSQVESMAFEGNKEVDVPGSWSELFLHLVWTTWDRQPHLSGDVTDTVYKCIRDQCEKAGAEVIALNGVADHVHLLTRVPNTLSATVLAKQVKGASSHQVHTVLGHNEFRWQEGYAVLSVSR